ncbi:hypothetical protein NKH77_48955 [Streptomyces sp. M19]
MSASVPTPATATATSAFAAPPAFGGARTASPEDTSLLPQVAAAVRAAGTHLRERFTPTPVRAARRRSSPRYGPTTRRPCVSSAST